MPRHNRPPSAPYVTTCTGISFQLEREPFDKFRQMATERDQSRSSLARQIVEAIARNPEKLQQVLNA